MGAGSFFLVVLGSLLGAVLLATAIWLATPARPSPEAQDALVTDARMNVVLKPWIAFLPAEARAAGLILYPGARVEPGVYAKVARAIADDGYPALIIPMPLNLAVLAPGAAQGAMQQFPEVKSWVLAGHSLGGVAAAHFARHHPDRIAGLVLWAAVPACNDDISEATFPVASIYATEDGLVSPRTVMACRHRLPPGARFVEISGGNHAQFGRYPPQLGSRPATISADRQQDSIVQATIAVLSEVDGARR
jgi:hypothetical protein